MYQTKDAWEEHIRPQSGVVSRFDVAKLKSRSVDDNGQNTTRGLFQEHVCSKPKEQWTNNGTVEEKWIAIKTALTKAAQFVLGKHQGHQSDWYRENH